MDQPRPKRQLDGLDKLRLLLLLPLILLFGWNLFTAWNNQVRPFGRDFEGSPAQRDLVQRAKDKNGDLAAAIELWKLDLSGMALSDEDFEVLAGFRKLRELNLSRTNIDDRRLAQLKTYSLESLNLANTNVSDESLSTIRRFRNLRELDVAETKMTAAAVRDIHTNMPEIRARLYGRNSGHRNHCIQAALNKFVLVKSGDERAAFKFTELTRKGDAGAKYVWAWQPQKQGPFLSDTLQTGEAEVFERYRRYQEDGRNYVADDGGELYLRMGPVKLEWSSKLTVYFGAWKGRWKDPPPVLMALTPWEELNKIEFESEVLRWFENTSKAPF